MDGSPHARMVCPPADAGRSARLPGHGERPPSVDERLAPPETRVEYVRGVEVFAAPADERHARQHSQIDRVVGAHVKRPYAVAVDMLTRVDDASDFAPDVSVYEPIVDRRTKQTVGRKLEELAFEVIDKQAQAVPARKAMDLVARGVRRVFCVEARARRLSEWSREKGCWEPIAPGALLEDRCFVRPIRAEALVSSVLADDEVARALLVKRPPAIEAALSESRAEGRIEEKRAAVLRIFAARGIEVSARARARIEAESDAAVLDRWFAEALTVQKASQLFRR